MKPFFFAVAVLVAPLAFAQDVITIGSVHAESGTITVPISIRDASGTPLNANTPANAPQALSFQVHVSPEVAVTAMSFERAGVLQSLAPMYERVFDEGDAAGYIATFAQPIPFTVNAAAPGNRIGTLLITLAPGLSPNTPITLTLDAKLTALSNLTGTIVESQYTRKLQLVHGGITIGGTATTTTLTSNANPSTAGSPVTFTATITGATTGTVLFRDNGTLLGIAQVTSGVATFTTSALTQGAHTISAYFEGSGSARGSSATPLTQTVNAPPIVAPASITATATSASSVQVSWSAVAGAVSYEVWRSSNNTAAVLAGGSTATSFSDTGRTAGVTYIYSVRAVATGGGKSPESPRDAATTIVFTDNPATAGVTKIKREHINELRAAVNAYRASAGLSAVPFTDPTLTAATRIKAVHITELRNALAPARAAHAFPAVTFTNPSLAGSAMKAVHLEELRAAVK